MKVLEQRRGRVQHSYFQPQDRGSGLGRGWVPRQVHSAWDREVCGYGMKDELTGGPPGRKTCIRKGPEARGRAVRSENHAKREQDRPRTPIRGAGEPGRGAPRSWCSRLPREAGVGDMLAGAILAMWPRRECGL